MARQGLWKADDLRYHIVQALQESERQ